MALNYQLKTIKNYNNICWFPIPKGKESDYQMGYTTCTLETGEELYMNPVTNSLIWNTMTIGMGEITEENWKEFYARIHLLETLGGTFLNAVNELGESNPRYMTEEDIKNHIGLSTNAENLTELQFIKRYVRTKLKDWRLSCE